MISKRIVVINAKIPLYEYYKDNINYMNDIIELTINLLYKWKDSNHITRVIGIDDELKTDNNKDIAEWLNDFRVIGSKDR